MKSLASRRWICHEFGVNSPLTWAWRKVLRLSGFAFILCGFHFVLVSRGNSALAKQTEPTPGTQWCPYQKPFLLQVIHAQLRCSGSWKLWNTQRAEGAQPEAAPSFVWLFAHDNIVQHRKASQRVLPSLVWSRSQTARTRACLCWIYHNGAALFKDITSSLQSQQLLLWRAAVVIDVWNISWPQRCVFTKIHFKFALACSYFQGAFHFLITWSHFFAGLLEQMYQISSNNLVYLLEEKLPLQSGASLNPALLGPWGIS